VLLLLNWVSTEEKGVYTGKVFEYLGAKRPILAIPRLGGVVDELLKETGAGVSVGTKDEVVRVIRSWYAGFMNSGGVPYKGKGTVISKYTRAAQTEKLARIFEELT
jgi:hypothetical protein